MGFLTPASLVSQLNWETNVTSTKAIASAVSRNNSIAEVGGVYDAGARFTVNTGAAEGSTVIDVTFADNTTATLDVTVQAHAPRALMFSFAVSINGKTFSGAQGISN